MSDNAADNKRLIAKVDKIIADLEADLVSISNISPTNASDLRNLINQAHIDYADATKRIILGDEKGSKDLEDIVDSVSEKRARLLSSTVSDQMKSVRNSLGGISLFGNTTSFIDQLEEIEENNRSLANVADSIERANKLREQLIKISTLVKRLDREKNRAQYRVPFQIILWGIPIIAGFLVSDRFTLFHNFLFFLLLIAIAVIVGIFLKKRRFNNSTPSRIFRIMRLRELSLFAPMIMILIIVLPLTMGREIYSIYTEYVSTQAMQLSIGSIENVHQVGTEIELPYSVKYSGEGVAFNVSLSIDSPGLIPPDKPITYNAISEEEQSGIIKVVVPESIPDGIYPIKVICSFRNKYSSNGYRVERTVEIVVKGK